MLDSCFIELKLDLPGTKKVEAGLSYAKAVAAGEYTLRVDCYPRGGGDESDSEYISLVMWLLQASRPSVSSAIFEALVMGADGKPSYSLSKRSSAVEVSSMKNSNAFSAGCSARRVTHTAAWPRFAKRSDLEPLQASNGTVKLVFRVVVARDGGAIAVPATEIGDHLGRLLERAPHGSDVSFSVGSETFHAHRAVLAARSPVFDRELLGSMVEARMACIAVEGVQPAVFRALLRFAYTDKLPEGLDLAAESAMDFFQHLLVAADRYGMDRLKLVCANKLREGVTVDTVAGILACAETYNCPELTDSCMDFFLEEKNFKGAVLTEGFEQLMREFPSIIGELRKRARNRT